ncbi:hypothetical protein A1O7_08605 [Cladophialophora yegresii CBS 114405]|uniref:Uncharacterized protein n=1 Tax=Cladophialophora yegresii CBS 114405 TaxID=1182544 RepID=W9VU28_9EURO|nr:uncharacterized protein A1O7_08605 [Cladophialophora yegresii CBS 114405]EXJ55676.1 hypothetical protein A1O7_08605 [Cladophialophora yegresii CBS 114405]
MTDMSGQGCGHAVVDELERSSTSAATTPHPFDLEYPELPLHLSLDSLLAHSSSSSLSPTRTAMLPPEADQPSLDGSWASLVGEESSNEDDLQSEHTDVGSLLDVHSLDDVHSVTDEVTTDDAVSTDEEDLGDTLTEELDRGHILGPYIRHELPVHARASDSLQFLQCKEDTVQEIKPHTVTTFTASKELNEAEIQTLPSCRTEGTETTKYSRVIEMPVLEDGLDLNKHNHFKVLLLGRQIEQFRPEIQRKVGDALVTRVETPSYTNPTSVTRFLLVPNTFGPGAEPDFADLVAIDKQIDFDCYDLVTACRKPGQQTELILTNSQTGTKLISKRSGSRFVVDNLHWALPDLAIICVHLSDDGTMDLDSYRMISFAERHRIPHILIRMDRGWHGQYNGAVTVESLHERIQPQHKQLQHKGSPLLPVDMTAFLNLDSTQLNRHIAYVVMSAERAPHREVESQNFLQENAVEKPATLVNSSPQLNLSTLKNALMLLWVVGVYMFLGYQLWPVLSGLNSGGISGEVVSNISSQLPVPTTTIHSPCQGSSSTSCIPEQQTKALQHIPGVRSTKGSLVLADDPRRFRVSIAGDKHLLVKLPQVALNHKRRSELAVELRRDTQKLPAAVQELFEGVVSVQLLPHDAYGDFQVNLTMSRPELSEIINISFGDRYDFEGQHLKDLMSMLQDHVQAKISNISSSLRNIGPGLVSDRFQTLLRLARDRLDERRRRDSAHYRKLVELNMTSVQHKFHRQMQALHDQTVQRSRECFVHGQMLLDALWTKCSDACSRVVDTVGSVDQQRIRPRLGQAIVADKLETARGRAHRLVSGAARNLRARNAGG